MAGETVEKLSRVRAFLREHGLDAAVFATRAHFAWLTGGGDNHVVSQTDAGQAAIVVAARGATLVADAIEAPRIVNEEPVTGLQVRTHPWTTPLAEAVAKALPRPKGRAPAAVADDPGLGLPPLPEDFYPVRARLCDAEVKRYRRLGRDCSLAIETVARQVTVGDSGHQVEADLARHVLARGVQPHLILVAFDDRLKRYRHPVPTANHLRRHAMIVLCGQRHGLIANLTRIVHFGPVPPDIRRRHEAACRVEVALWNATRPDVPYGEVLRRGIAQYRKEGFAKEWQLHHQGGPTGYLGRDFLATPDEARPVLDRQAVAWNPSIAGTKAEDTVIVDGDELDVVTACSGNWPTLDVTVDGTTRQRPDILVR